MRALLTVGTLFVFTMTFAQGVTEVASDSQYLAQWLIRGTTVEVEVPAGATVYALRYGSEAIPSGMSTFLHSTSPTEHSVLTVTVIPPDQPGGAGICPLDHGLATLFVVQGAGSSRETIHVPFCAAHPVSGAALGQAHALPGPVAELGYWTPIYFNAWLPNGDYTDAPATLPGHAFAVQIAFMAGNSTAFPDESPLTITQMLNLPALEGLRQQLWPPDVE